MQTDGWLSERSAKVYELSTETLFLGRQDAMQRQTLVPLGQHLRSLPASDAAPPRVLELACGTGRFSTFIKVARQCRSLSSPKQLTSFWQSAVHDGMQQPWQGWKVAHAVSCMRQDCQPLSPHPVPGLGTLSPGRQDPFPARSWAPLSDSSPVYSAHLVACRRTTTPVCR